MPKSKVYSKGKLIAYIILVTKYHKKMLIGAIEDKLKLLRVHFLLHYGYK